MSTEAFETLSQLSETTLENYRKIGETNLKIGEKLLQQQAELTSSLIDAAKSKADKVAGAKDYQSLASNQAELVQECTQIVWESCKSCAEIVAEAGKFYNQLFEAGVKSANANVAKAASAAKGRKSA